MISRAAFLQGGMGTESPNPVDSLYRVYDPSILQSNQGAVDRDPVESPCFFPPPEIGVGNGAGKSKQLTQDQKTYGSDPEADSSQEFPSGCLIFGFTHR